MPLPRNTLPKDRATRTVKVLFPQTRIEISDETIQFYKAHQPFAFAFDRQSDKGELTRAESTGADRRVRMIQGTAQEKNLYLPLAVPRPNRQDGDLPFDLDTAFWFVDGEQRRATGYAANQNARPRLWEGFLLAQALAEHGAGPTMFVVGEATRFFRNEKWLMEFSYAIWEKGIELVVHPFGPVTRHTLQGLTAYVNALSGWLPMVTAGSRETRKAQRRPFSTTQPFGLRTSGVEGTEAPETRLAIWTDVGPWNAFSDAIEALATGAVTCIADATILIQQFGFTLSTTRVQQLIHSTIPEGVHVLYRYQCKPRRLVQEGGLFSDLDITEGGNRRYLYEEQPGVPMTIQFTPGTQPISTTVLLAARARITGNGGRPPSKGRGAGYGMPDYKSALLPTRLLRCATCGHSLRLMPPRRGSNKTWTVVCNCVQTLRMRLKLSRPDARTYVETHCPHSTYANVDLGALVWERVSQALVQMPPPREEDDPKAVWVLREREARRTLREREAAFHAFQKRCADGEMGDLTNRWVAASVDSERATLIVNLESAEADVKRLTAENLTAHKASVHREQVARVFTALAHEADTQVKQELLAMLVERVVVHLDERWYEITVSCDWPTLLSLQERAAFDGNAETVSHSWTLGRFQLPLLRGSWPVTGRG